jgi:hypothetical protein
MSKRLVVLFSVLIAASMVLAACGGGNSAAKIVVDPTSTVNPRGCRTTIHLDGCVTVRISGSPMYATLVYSFDEGIPTLNPVIQWAGKSVDLSWTGQTALDPGGELSLDVTNPDLGLSIPGKKCQLNYELSDAGGNMEFNYVCPKGK